MTSTSFEYPLLDKTKSQIRLLEILQQSDSSLQYSLTTFDVAICPNYIALSYVWGDDEPSNTIVINGQDFKIRDNLSHALPHLAVLRNQRSEQHFWIDAICINQEDTKERNHQVGIMKDIFTSASLTAAWLSEDEETTQLLLRPELSRFPHSSESEIVEKIASNEYFQRMWIVQEIILSRDIWFLYDSMICPLEFAKHELNRIRSGRTMYAEFDPYRIAAASLASIGIAEEPPLATLNSALWWREAYQDRHNRLRWHLQLDKLLHSFFDRKCSDPRDRIFSLLGLLPCETLDSSPLPIDYDISLEDLFSLVLEHINQRSWGIHPEDSENLNVLFSSAYNARNLRFALNLDTKKI